jgi:hypothetical protein
VLHQREKVVPSYGLKGLGDVELEEQDRCFGSVEPSCEIAYIKVVILDAPLLDEELWKVEMS